MPEISIHALLAESDKVRYFIMTNWTIISIHALLAESDKLTACQNGQLHDFYPRSPCGERRIKPIFGKIDANFYPRSPCGERL